MKQNQDFSCSMLGSHQRVLRLIEISCIRQNRSCKAHPQKYLVFCMFLTSPDHQWHIIVPKCFDTGMFYNTLQLHNILNSPIKFYSVYLSTRNKFFQPFKRMPFLFCITLMFGLTKLTMQPLQQIFSYFAQFLYTIDLIGSQALVTNYVYNLSLF